MILPASYVREFDVATLPVRMYLVGGGKIGSSFTYSDSCVQTCLATLRTRSEKLKLNECGSCYTLYCLRYTVGLFCTARR